MKYGRRSFTVPLLAVILPLLVLAVLAWAGIASLRQSAWTTARNSADSLASSTASILARDLETRARPVPVFNDPPLPGPPDAADDPLLSDHQDKLRDLVMNSIDGKPASAGLSPAGLPRRLLAALRLLESTGDEFWAELVSTIAVEEPSALSIRALEEVSRRYPTKQRSQYLWEQSLAARRLALSHPEVAQIGGWIDGYWIGPRNGSAVFLDPDQFKSIAAPVNGMPWASIRLKAEGRILAGSTTGRILSSSPVAFGKGLTLEVLATDPALVESQTRQIQRWVTAVLLVAMVSSAGGLLLIRRAFEREQKLNTLKSDFVASVSHELRAPIASIRLMADALESRKIHGEPAAEFHRLISREGTRLSTLIENVLDFARIEEKRKDWDFREGDLVDAIHLTMPLMLPLAGEKSMSLCLEHLPETAPASFDAGAVQQALVNLIDNAIKFSPPGSRITVGLRASAPDWRLSVADEGPGIPKGDHQRIFEKFHRLGGELRRETQGTGIGLSIVKAIAEAHGGTVSVESQPGSGSTFTLTIPMDKTQPSSANEP